MKKKKKKEKLKDLRKVARKALMSTRSANKVSEDSLNTHEENNNEETMNETIKRIEYFSVHSNMTVPIQTGTPTAPIHQVQAGTAALVASSVTVSAKKESSS